jgi:hypothetical protein
MLLCSRPSLGVTGRIVRKKDTEFSGWFLKCGTAPCYETSDFRKTVSAWKECHLLSRKITSGSDYDVPSV